MTTSAIVSVFAAQRETALRLRGSSADLRIAVLKRLEAAVLARRKSIYQALADDLRKSQAEADLAEFLPVIGEIRHAKRHLCSWMRDRRVPPTRTMLGTSARIRHEPKGVSLIISPWNFPFNLTLGPLASAIAAGCPAIIKPSELSPASSLVLAGLIRDNFDPADIALFEGDASISTALLDLPFDHVFFTGSPEIGKVVMAAAAQHLAAVTLELGGKSPVIVTGDADIAKAARSIAFGKFSNAGQTCIAPDHAYVHESVLSSFITAMQSRIATMYGNAMESDDYCRIINARHFERVARLIDDAVARGGTLHVKGARNAAQNFIPPALVTGLASDAAIMREEIFGPVLPILPYRDLAEPIRAINARPKPLALYVFARNQAQIAQLLRETSSGGVCVNTSMMQFLHGNLPFGGINHSGLGSAHGFYGFRAFSHERAVLIEKASMSRMLAPPYTKRVRSMIKATVRFFT